MLRGNTRTYMRGAGIHYRPSSSQIRLSIHETSSYTDTINYIESIVPAASRSIGTILGYRGNDPSRAPGQGQSAEMLAVYEWPDKMGKGDDMQGNVIAQSMNLCRFRDQDL
ncbi:hypothetical protein PC9H_009127 [Pleurotus ostreatus]|uniref:Uncharacterized protein n=2 Tax=Pleurotus ostreatus TaxID=5322 RepID=A0A067N2C8_PLEO1|nr:uncharacterized protein PC9H_009127 [Pleurotus ostreatus]KAF7426758.1 hypothetical protein PC9H_009127 [Pleurotus ostreatus]KDQ22009.1 hypothetical protein PLEOSDRAFT_1110125 [Pleurotus ostreatus PC15]